MNYEIERKILNNMSLTEEEVNEFLFLICESVRDNFQIYDLMDTDFKMCYETSQMFGRITLLRFSCDVEILDIKKILQIPLTHYANFISFYVGDLRKTYLVDLTYSQFFGDMIILDGDKENGNVEIPKDLKFEIIDILESTGNVTNYSSVLNDIKINTSTGDIKVENIFGRKFELTTSTGKISVNNVVCDNDINIFVSTGMINISDISCKNIVSRGSAGDTILNNVIAAGKLSIERSTGDVMFKSSHASEIFVKTDTGDIKITVD